MLNTIFVLLYATSIFTMTALALSSAIVRDYKNEAYAKQLSKYTQVNTLINLGLTVILILINY
jgi:hypothetical protein